MTLKHTFTILFAAASLAAAPAAVAEINRTEATLLGTAVGGLIGNATGNDSKSTLMGAAAGGLLGNLIGYNLENRDAERIGSYGRRYGHYDDDDYRDREIRRYEDKNDRRYRTAAERRARYDRRYDDRYDRWYDDRYDSRRHGYYGEGLRGSDRITRVNSRDILPGVHYGNKTGYWY